MKTKALTSAALIACLAACSPVIKQTALQQGRTGACDPTSNLAKDGRQSGMSTSGGSVAEKMPKTGMTRAKGLPALNEEPPAIDASGTATQGGGSSPLTTGEGMKQPSRTAR